MMARIKNCKPKELLFLQLLSPGSSQSHGLVWASSCSWGSGMITPGYTFTSQWGPALVCLSECQSTVPQKPSWPSRAFTAPDHDVCVKHDWLCPTALLCLGGEGPSSCAELSLDIGGSLILCFCSSPSHWETMTLHCSAFFSCIHGLTLLEVMPAAATQGATQTLLLAGQTQSSPRIGLLITSILACICEDTNRSQRAWLLRLYPSCTSQII